MSDSRNSALVRSGTCLDIQLRQYMYDTQVFQPKCMFYNIDIVNTYIQYTFFICSVCTCVFWNWCKPVSPKEPTLFTPFVKSPNIFYYSVLFQLSLLGHPVHVVSEITQLDTKVSAVRSVMASHFWCRTTHCT